MAETLSDLRRRAWKTRRAKYGASGHAGSYSRGSAPCWACERMTKLIIGLHADGTLSEGQAIRATGLGRVEFRRRADELAETGESA